MAGTTVYPDNIDPAAPDPSASGTTLATQPHSSLHNNEDAKIRAVEETIGTTGSFNFVPQSDGTVSQDTTFSGDVTLSGASTGVTQDANDDSTNLATTAYADASSSAAGTAAKNASVPLSTVGQPNGVASLDESGFVPTDELGNLVTSFNGRNGEVEPESGDYTVSQVTGAAPLASPALTGIPTAPTASALTDSEQVGTTAYTDAAVLVEKGRAETAEAALLPLAGGTMTGAIALGANKITGLANGSASSDAAAFGQIAAALTAYESAAVVVASASSATLGANLAGTSWTFGGDCTESGNGGAFGGSGGGTMSQSVTLPGAGTYVLTYTTAGNTAGNLTLSLGAANSPLTPYYTNISGFSFVVASGGSVTLEFTGDATYNGTITSVALEEITAFVPAALTIQSPSGTTRLTIQALAGNNLGLGHYALYSNTTGVNNLGLGSYALYSNTTGGNNLGLGYQALYSNTTGGSNLGLGYQALYSNTTGANNLGLGYQALYSNTTGGSNLGLGSYALYSNTTGGSNLGLGSYALYSNTTGSSNLGLGCYALYSNTTGGNNLGLGSYALYSNTTGGNNLGLGYYALYSNTTGGNNLGLGSYALYSNTTGVNNLGLGYQALHSNTTGSNNTVVGTNAAYAPGGSTTYATTQSNYQTVVGYEAGLSASDAVTAINGITTIGYYALGGGSYATSLGYKASAGAAGAVAIGSDHTGTGASTTTQDQIALGTANHQVKIANNTTGSGSAALGSNCPATTATAPYTWFKMTSSDGSTVYVPAWK